MPTDVGQEDCRVLGPVHSKPEKLENGDFTLKMHQMLSVHTTREEFKNAAITGHSGFVLDENSIR